MGQYYKPCLLDKNKKTVRKWFYSHAYGEKMGGFCGLKLMEHSWLGNKFVGAVESILLSNPQRIVWAGDYADECKGLKTNVYSRCKDNLEVSPEVVPPQIVKAKYIVNHDKKMFVDKSKVPDNDGWKIHPLPLLTNESNNRGGGDYRDEESDTNHIIGSWARDLISVESRKPKGYTELEFNLIEE